ncbi:hypothetical protein tinsulaeT_02850 [Thalassotalea insulae]|uniref:DUF3545 family protein n=1 Tax=Thalassotalea insulae TaxID=2056778 RepID=A0ABQ6GR79_9GAMM|nr:DUF3545 family protein [Thalassotalea insulae]GLX76945.1 hypothetical protein tinsulaeT_02850 [Thalassotalea insulae]
MASKEIFDQYFQDDTEYLEQKSMTKSKTRKRKWREIESIKEQRRLRRELAQYDLYSY